MCRNECLYELKLYNVAFSFAHIIIVYNVMNYRYNANLCNHLIYLFFIYILSLTQSHCANLYLYVTSVIVNFMMPLIDAIFRIRIHIRYEMEMEMEMEMEIHVNASG
jgi:hypothetical protein